MHRSVRFECVAESAWRLKTSSWPHGVRVPRARREARGFERVPLDALRVFLSALPAPTAQQARETVTVQQARCMRQLQHEC